MGYSYALFFVVIACATLLPGAKTGNSFVSAEELVSAEEYNNQLKEIYNKLVDNKQQETEANTPDDVLPKPEAGVDLPVAVIVSGGVAAVFLFALVIVLGCCWRHKNQKSNEAGANEQKLKLIYTRKSEKPPENEQLDAHNWEKQPLAAHRADKPEK